MSSLFDLVDRLNIYVCIAIIVILTPFFVTLAYMYGGVTNFFLSVLVGIFLSTCLFLMVVAARNLFIGFFARLYMPKGEKVEENRYWEAELATQNGDYEGAIDLYKIALLNLNKGGSFTDPSSWIPQYRIAQIADRYLHDYERALKEYSITLKLKPTEKVWLSICLRKAEIYEFELNMPIKTIEEHEKVIHAFPHSVAEEGAKRDIKRIRDKMGGEP